MLELYKNIKKRRLELDMTQSELALALGYADKSMIAKIEKGTVDLPLSKIELLADALHTQPGKLMGNSWENDILDNAHLDVAAHFNGDAFEVAKFQQAEPGNNENFRSKTIAAHFDGLDYTKEQLERIKSFAAFIKSEDEKNI